MNQHAPSATRPEPAQGKAASFEPWDGTTYYGRAQLKPAPFQNPVVGGYIFLAGLSGSSAILACLADLSGDPRLEGMARRGRYLALLAPTLGSALLIYDLHTPGRFYNMLRIAKATSPMSIGTWILMGFSGAAGVTATAQLVSDLWPRRRWPRRVASGANLLAALLGAGLSTYTAALLSATSTPLWAAAPRALAVRFGSSSLAAASAALSLGEGDAGTRAKLDGITAVALATELAASAQSRRAYEARGVAPALASPSGALDRWGAARLGVLLPLGALAVSALLGRRRGRTADLACLTVLAGSAALRVATLGAGDVSAERPDVSFAFSQPRNLPASRGVVRRSGPD